MFMNTTVSPKVKPVCNHCGEECSPGISMNGKSFCCNGCMTVYSLLNSHHLDDYYCLNETPGISVKETSASKFRFLDDESIAAQLISFKDEERTQVTFYLPQIHCSSCLWLLENLQRLNKGF